MPRLTLTLLYGFMPEVLLITNILYVITLRKNIWFTLHRLLNDAAHQQVGVTAPYQAVC